MNTPPKNEYWFFSTLIANEAFMCRLNKNHYMNFEASDISSQMVYIQPLSSHSPVKITLKSIKPSILQILQKATDSALQSVKATIEADYKVDTVKRLFDMTIDDIEETKKIKEYANSNIRNIRNIRNNMTRSARILKNGYRN